jgi:hypothetical protein
MARRAGVVIVSMHGGDDYRQLPNRRQVEFARAAIGAGRIPTAHKTAFAFSITCCAEMP